ncbi:MAG: ABC transporter ATP-binding protein [Actinobacteria bacterium]|nr:ABC transporter ATP-binding protein [Actinomycetota bacterium]MCB9389308.1 ABC transporter ATP-binding protein [Acidimicrobiia bacterium]
MSSQEGRVPPEQNPVSPAEGRGSGKPVEWSSTAVISIDEVSKWFGDVVALSEVTCTFASGVTALLGANGAGKSTLFRAIAGLSPPTLGAVRILGTDPRRSPDVFAQVGMVPQQEALPAGMTAREFVRSCAALSGVANADARAADMLGRVDLDPTDKRDVSTYSKGMTQRVKIAQALVHEPDVVLMDEPLNGLDPRQRVSMIDLIGQLGAEGRTVVVSSHILEEVARLSSRIVVLAKGRLAAVGDYHEIRDLMDDRPHKIMIMTSRPRELAGALLASGAVDGVSVVPPRRTAMLANRVADELPAVLVDTVTVKAFRTQIVRLSRDLGAELFEVRPLDDSLEDVFRYLVGDK